MARCAGGSLCVTGCRLTIKPTPSLAGHEFLVLVPYLIHIVISVSISSKDGVVCDPHVACSTGRTDFSDAGAHAGGSNGKDWHPRAFAVVSKGGDHGCAKGEVDVDAPGDPAGNAHGRRTDEERDPGVARLDNEGLPYRQFTEMLGMQERLQLPLKPATEELRVREVDAAIHIAEAVCRADKGIGRDLKDAAVRDINFRNISERRLPCKDNVGVDVAEDDGGNDIGSTPRGCHCVLEFGVAEVLFGTAS